MTLINDGYTFNIVVKAAPKLKALYDGLEILHHDAGLLEDEGADHAGADKIDAAMAEVARQIDANERAIEDFLEIAPEHG
tara:strand:+ start:495 stop:734 length:240 start_codon:yes stop_codon:yes gene_type:complete